MPQPEDDLLQKHDDLNDKVTLTRRISKIAFAAIIAYSMLGYKNGSHKSALTLLICGLVLLGANVLSKKLPSPKVITFSRTLLLFISNLTAFVANLASPYDDGGRFYFVPISLMSLLIFESREKRWLVFGVSLPMVFYLISLFFLPPESYLGKAPPIELETARVINFFGVYIISAIEIFIFVRHIVRLQTHAIAQSKFYALGIMAAGIAHEIKNPLAIISMRAQSLERRIDELAPEEIRRNVESISLTTKRIETIIASLKRFSREASNDSFTALSGKSLTKTALDLCQSRFKNTAVKLQVDHEQDLSLQGREAQLVQVLVNLMSNAFDAAKASPAPGCELRFYQRLFQFLIAAPKFLMKWQRKS